MCIYRYQVVTPPQALTAVEEDSAMSWWLILVIAVAAILILLVLVIVLVTWYKGYWGNRRERGLIYPPEEPKEVDTVNTRTYRSEIPQIYIFTHLSRYYKHYIVL